MKKILLIILISCILFPSLMQAQTIPTAPETLEEAKETGQELAKGFPGVFKKLWKEALQIWGSMWEHIKSFWLSYIEPQINKALDWAKSFFTREFEEREAGVREELEKEKQEMKQVIPSGKTIWQRFKDIVKWW